MAGASSYNFENPNGVPIAAGDLPSGIDAAKVADASVSNAEFQRLDGVTSAIQTQINAKPSLSSATPQPIGTAAAGTGTAASKDDHAHALPATGTAGTYAYPSSLTTDAQGRVSSVTAGSAPVVGEVFNWVYRAAGGINGSSANNYAANYGQVYFPDTIWNQIGKIRMPSGSTWRITAKLATATLSGSDTLTARITYLNTVTGSPSADTASQVQFTNADAANTERSSSVDFTASGIQYASINVIFNSGLSNYAGFFYVEIRRIS